MSNILAIYKRELKSYFVSPIAYISMAVFFVISGFIFFNAIRGSQQAQINAAMQGIAFILFFITPFITMRLLAEEENQKTLELLLTSPLKPLEIVLGKYFAAFTLMMVFLSGLLIHVLILLIYSPLDLGVVFSSFLGVSLLISALLGIGLACSSLVSSQISAGLIGLGVSLVLIFMNLSVGSADTLITKIMKELSPIQHLVYFLQGAIDFKHILAFVMWVILSIAISTKSLEAKLLR